MSRLTVRERDDSGRLVASYDVGSSSVSRDVVYVRVFTMLNMKICSHRPPLMPTTGDATGDISLATSSFLQVIPPLCPLVTMHHCIEKLKTSLTHFSLPDYLW